MPRRPSPVAGLLLGLVLPLLLGTVVEASTPARPPVEGAITAAARAAAEVITTATPPLPACRYKDVLTRYRGLRWWRRTLLDTNLRVGRSYRPKDLQPVSDAHIGGGGRVRGMVIDDLRAMAAAARAAGKGIAVRSAYRSFQDQVATFAGWVAREGYKRALLFSARPGHSEHQLGTTIDFRSAGSATPAWAYADWSQTKAGRWMANHAWEYGFLMSYPRDQTAETCYGYEPWHFRYVGRDLARTVHDSGLTLRRYLWRQFETAP